MPESNSYDKLKTLSMAPENGRAEIHSPQLGDNTKQDKAVKIVLNSITEHKKDGMGQLPATAICGNDIASLCLYVSAPAIIYAARWAPLALLNTTSKFKASIAFANLQ